jgi:dUTP pyrophosphatase
MILPKHEIVSRGLVKHYVSDAQFQPAGVDLTLQKVFSLANAGAIDHDNKERQLSEAHELAFDGDGWIALGKGAYKVIYNEVVSIPADCCALAFTRSSLLRCGAFVACAVWDAGYTGRSESLLVVENDAGLRLKKDAKLIQLVFVKLSSEAKHLYEGRYKGENI